MTLMAVGMADMFLAMRTVGQDARHRETAVAAAAVQAREDPGPMPTTEPLSELLAADELPFVITPGLVIAVLITVFVLLVLLGVASWLVWRRVRRSGRLERGMAVLRAATLPEGPRREIAELRVELHDSLAQSRRVVGNTALGVTPASLADLQRRLRRSGEELDVRLQLLVDEPDTGLLTRLLPRLRERVAAITANSSALRQTALQFGEELDASRRALLEQDLHDEIAGLESGVREVRALGSTGEHRAPSDDPAPGTGPNDEPRA